MSGKKLNLKWVSDEIGNDYKEWKRGDIITINAQTGTGKTFFIKNVLIPHMAYEKMLIVANRVNLKRQLKKDLCKYYNKPLPTDLSDLDNLNVIGDVTIMSYQQLGNIIHDSNYGKEKLDLSMYDYIICDEAHFFMTDAGFNNKCDLVFFELVRKKHDAIKIFISATMDEIYPTIQAGAEDTNSNLIGKKYNTGVDYSYVNTKYFRNLNDIAKLIKNDKTDEKWLIFVKSKDDGEKLENQLKDICSCEFITRETNIKKSENLRNIISDSNFVSKVLITTKVMDNGINIDDDKLKNMVIMTYDNVSFIQMLGRLRVDIENAPRLNLFIPLFNRSNFNPLITKIYEPRIEMIKLFEKERTEFNRIYDRSDKLPSSIFIKINGAVDINILGRVRLDNDYEFVKNIDGKLKNDEFAYIKQQLKWIGLENEFNKENLIEHVVDKKVKIELGEFLETACNDDARFSKDILKNTMLNIINKDNNLMVKFNKLDGGNKRDKGMKKINELLISENYDYIVGSKRETINGVRDYYWRVLRNI
ncbi:DEAD/DEAH box helicase family protein [[Clostridium] bifermentans ATCC 638]|uniref:DEAD/DEAH box helicase family protein n=1 Tax=Paraclostridium bifermentans ATCC 638 = DSM 14991 TaxID=1233171 RepID=T4VN44_PARBF|nr:DEAD/DEAH box helicase family protein [Paraclostridium bifermentans]EQK42928.1 DEAD/DEAH box helicase family protein [[Clostridium] bifermentans ATCC 638] [Paraclostridium bifermentans ATCC 638 = DSM 14991]RIZ58055.1 hypothetical protein CHH45_13485 [Paraclostridium bifermentans]UAG16811.1 DEAD/DEAH box helicase family protein [Paraclostridium bifermentans]